MKKTQDKVTLKADFCVIGAGSAGLSFAAGAAQMGAAVILLEKAKMGGDCLNYGCVPSKSLIAAAKFRHRFDVCGSFGWKNAHAELDYKAVHRHVHEVIDAIAPNDSVERFVGLGANVIQEGGRFIDHHTIETESHWIKAKRFIIATGSHPFIPKIPGLDQVNFLTNETIFDLAELPKHLAIIGGGPIGIEMAQAFKRLGSQVTVFQTQQILPKDDPEFTQMLKTILIQEGIIIEEHAQVESVVNDNNIVQINYLKNGERMSIIASHILIAAGQKPSIEHLNLEAAGVGYSSKGIKVDQQLRTTNNKIYAIGDCIGDYQFTHVAGYHAGLAIRNSIFGLCTKVQTKAIPWVTYTDPELAHVGMSEKMVKEKNIPHRILKLNFHENDRAQCERRTEGFIKVIASPKGHVLGATILGVHAGELIYPWVMAVQNNLKLSSITSTIAPYPTLNEISKKIAGQFYTQVLFSSKMKKFVRFLMGWRS